jgi:hypothetical protein
MRSNEMSVVLFSGLHGRVAQQLLDRPDVRPVGQQLHREGIAEPVRMGVDAGYLPDSLYRPAHIFDARHHVAFPRPKEVFRVLRGQGGQGIGRRRVQKNLQPDPVFENAERQMPGGSQGGTLQFSDVRNAEPAVEQYVHQGARAASHVLGFGRVVAGQVAGRRDQAADLISRERLSLEIVDKRHFQFSRGVFLTPSALLAPIEERAKRLQFLAPCARGYRAGTLVGVERRRAYCRHGLINERFERGQVSERLAVTGQGGRLQVSFLRGGDEQANCSRDGGASRNLLSLAVSVFQFRDPAQRPGCIRRPKTLADPLTVQHAVGPDRTPAKGVSLPFGEVRAVGKVAAVGGQHPRILSVVYVSLYVEKKSMKNLIKMAEASGGRTHQRYKVTHAGFEVRARHRPGLASVCGRIGIPFDLPRVL